MRHGQGLRELRLQGRVGRLRRGGEREERRERCETWAEKAPNSPAAHVRPSERLIIELLWTIASQGDGRDPVASRPARGAELPPRASVEDTLTSGYAYVLGLERDRLQIERALRACLRSDDRPDRDELAELSGRLAQADQELAAVRAMLASLRAQALC